MIKFVNAKINIGLYVTARRPDGYHDLSTLFYPVGKYAGSPENPVAFCDILELTPAAAEEGEYIFTGKRIDCPLDKNLVVKASRLFREEMERRGLHPGQFDLRLDKHLPDGAGLGGGSADCAFTLLVLNELCGFPFSGDELIGFAARLGADCPFFILNTPAYAEGIGERLTPVKLPLKGKWCAIVKPPVYVSTKEAFAGIKPALPKMPLLDALKLPIEEWRNVVFNDFEKTIFPLHPELAAIKEGMYRFGALYASMSGSGSSLYGIFSDRESAECAAAQNPEAVSSVLLL